MLSLSPLASADCDPAADFDGFKAWIAAIKTKDCASRVISRHPELEARQGGATLVDATNGYHAVFGRFFEILGNDQFAGSIREIVFSDDNIKVLGIGKPVSEFRPLLISLPEPLPRGEKFSGVIKVGNISVGNYRSYLQLCVDEVDREKCDAWISTVRLMAAVDYLAADFRRVLNTDVLDKFETQLQRYIDVWDDYYEQRKPQMPWEMAINQVANRDIRTAKYFATPPRGDWVVMHPSLVYSSVSAADDGDEKDFALAIELIGYNWWKNDKLSGFSLVGVTSDRDGIEDEGYGLMLHFGSRYSLGWTRHDDDDGWFVSIDLLGAAINKKKELRQWEDDFRAAVEELKQ